MRALTWGVVIVVTLLASGQAAVAQTSSRVDPLRSVATALVKPNALLVLDLSASMQCDLQAAFWPAGQETVFGSTDKRTCVDQLGIPTGVRTGDFFADDATTLNPPTLADDFALADWTLEYNSEATGSGGGVPPPGTGGVCVTGASALTYNKKKVEWSILNDVDAARTISSISITWPAANSHLSKVKLDGVTIHDQDFPVASAVINSGWMGTLGDRTLVAGQSAVLGFEFGSNSQADESQYMITVVFDDGCTLVFDTAPGGSGGDPPGVGCASGGPTLTYNKKNVDWSLTNDVDVARTISSISITWPAGNKKLKKITLDGVQIHDVDFVEPSAVINSGWDGTVGDRTLDPGESAPLLFEFEDNALQNDGQYEITVVFDDGCILVFGSGPGGGGDPPSGDGCASGELTLAYAKKKADWIISNDVDVARTISSISISWPVENENLDTIKIDATQVHDQNFPWPSAVINSGWQGTVDDRTLDPGQSVLLRFEFTKNTIKDDALYDITVVFDDGCTLVFGTEAGSGSSEGFAAPLSRAALSRAPEGCTAFGSGPCNSANCLLCEQGGLPPLGAFRWRWHDASRMAVVKNLLGDSVPIRTLDGPMTLAEAPTDYFDTCVPPPPAPLPVRNQAPLGLVDANFDKVNFGLGVFSCLECHNHNIGDYKNEDEGKDPKGCKITNDDFVEACGFVDDPFPDPDDPLTGNKPVYDTLVGINTEDVDFSGQQYVRDAINAYLSPTTHTTALTDPDGNPVSIQGLQSYTATPTPCAIRCARFSFERDVFPTDPKLATCQRKNYVILITDGQSTEINNNHNTKACGDNMPWDMADEMYTITRANLTALGNPEGAIRTFVVGLSAQTTTGSARTELNQIAFKGRTDAGDSFGGVKIPGDDAHWGGFDPGHNYAYFATNAQELASALQRVVAAISAVDLATSPPVSTRAGALQVFGGDRIGLLASSQFPESFGHLRLFNLEKVETDPDFLLWDVGQELTDRDLTAEPRVIYTSDPGNGHALVPLIPGDLAAVPLIQASLEGPPIADEEALALIDFLHGLPVLEDPFDPSSPTHQRPWRLGDITNSTPAIISGPPLYPSFISHKSFRARYQSRHPQVFVGANDLMLHAVDMVDGHEVWSYLPPSILNRAQELHEQWKRDNYQFMGQPFASLEHVYGVAGSPRLVDIEDTSGNWLTALFSGLGPGGETVFALDVTHTYPGRTVGAETFPADPDYDVSEPFKVLWFHTPADVGFEDLGETWSVPAIGLGEGGAGLTWMAAFGSAYGSGDQGRFVHLVDAFSGSLISKRGLAVLGDRAGQLVTDNFYFADTVGYSTISTKAEAPLNFEVQADLAGRLWETEVDNPAHGHSMLFDAGEDQPIYFAPAVSTFRTAGPFTVAAYASGTYDEIDPRVNGASATIAPHLFISITSLDRVDQETVAIDITDPTELLKPDGTAFSDGTRPVSSPLTVISNSGIAKSFFTLFDPVATGGDCFGRSFIVEAEYAPDPVGGTTVNTTVHSISTGKVSGFALGRDSIVVGISGTGGDEARIVPFADTDLALPGALLEVLNWRELF